MTEFDEDTEDPDEFDALEHSDDAEPDEIPCPYCGKPVYEQAELCPHCRSYISQEDHRHRWPRWIWIGFGLALAAMLTWAVAHL